MFLKFLPALIFCEPMISTFGCGISKLVFVDSLLCLGTSKSCVLKYIVFNLQPSETEFYLIELIIPTLVSTYYVLLLLLLSHFSHVRLCVTP